ncbi:tricarballylate utilization 4Fe-4S protein TcuB [Mangrovihabitans endophyticus]|uniref:Tricarballylate utilization protein B n=1 Tax=Mangrovihabitans endophyticus TaxID=1751298 RepID=A0A8J3C4U1_9ACTN|nr:tricarballylate utilization 4Fe-4S protein TcuB [Mangrovihabitans endophyticus]GGL09446.1 tricarballylate utilization protein B [Mangrovihabitans endophyticus]
MPMDDLFAEAQRQLTVCNACRYCAGYCPVWPALTLRTDLTTADVTHLANLCHDCGDCFAACMYTAPHEFALNPPKVFAQVREDTYRRYVWPRRAPRWLGGRRGALFGFLAVAVLLTLLGYATTGRFLSAQADPGSPYEILPHLVMVLVAGGPAGYSMVVLADAARRYWADVHGPLRDLAHRSHWPVTLVQAAHLRHMHGGGQGCDYPAGEPSPLRRRLHLAVSYGFGLCVLSTASAALMQKVLAVMPPYPYWSVPVVTGTVGGVAIVAGCLGLLALKRRSLPDLGTDATRRADHHLLWALSLLAVSGLLTLVLRTGPLFSAVLVVHLAAVVVAFAIAPYTKFTHGIYRVLAIYKDNLETARRTTP